MNPLFPAREPTEIERRLRAAAPAFGPRPPSQLHDRIVAALHAVPRSAAPRAVERRARLGTGHLGTGHLGTGRLGTGIAAAAAAVVLCSAWWLTHRAGARAERFVGSEKAVVVALSRGLLDAGTRVLELPGQAEGNLRLEAEKLLADTTRVAEGVVRGLPAPLRARLQQM